MGNEDIFLLNMRLAYLPVNRLPYPKPVFLNHSSVANPQIDQKSCDPLINTFSFYIVYIDIINDTLNRV